MKSFWKEFLLRGLLCAAGGPLVLGIIYACLGAADVVDTLTPKDVSLSILSITLLAFTAAGMTAIYQQEQLPLPYAILIHGCGLYVAYILVYLINGWLARRLVTIGIFTGIFVAGYGLIWLIIYLVSRKNIRRINENLKK